MILLPSRRITKPQSGGSVDLQRAHDSGTLYLSFADAGFTDRIGGGVVRNPGGLALGPNGKIATFNGAQQVNSPVWLGDSHTGLIVAARILATGAQSGTPGAAFGVYDSASQGGFGVGFDPSGNAGAALLTSGGAYLNARSAVGLNKWVTVFAQISGVNAGFSVAYVDGQPATVGQAGSYAGDPRVPREIAYGAQHRSSGFLRQFKGDVEWAAILRVAPDGGWRSLTDSLALELYESGYPYNLIKTTRRVYFDMGAGGGGTAHTVTADPVEQGSTTTRPGLTQTHVTTASAVAQGATVSRPAVTQAHVVTARAVAQGSTVNAPTVEVGGITVVTARPVVQSSTVNAPSIVQTHIVTARPSAQGGTVTRPGQAQGPQTGSMRPGFEMSSRKVYIKRGKRIHIFDSVEDADAWMEAEQQEIQAIRRAKPTPRKKAKVFKALDEAIPHEVVRLDVVRAMVDYLGIPVEMPTLEARQDWAEVARVALMARHMQDEEDIELLLVA